MGVRRLRWCAAAHPGAKVCFTQRPQRKEEAQMSGCVYLLRVCFHGTARWGARKMMKWLKKSYWGVETDTPKNVV